MLRFEDDSQEKSGEQGSSLRIEGSMTIPGQSVQLGRIPDIGGDESCYLAIFFATQSAIVGWETLGISGRFPQSQNCLVIPFSLGRTSEDAFIGAAYDTLRRFMGKGAKVLWDESGEFDDIALFRHGEMYIDETTSRAGTVSLNIEARDGDMFSAVVETHCLYVLTELLDRYLMTPEVKLDVGFGFEPRIDAVAYEEPVSIITCGHRELITPSVLFDIPPSDMWSVIDNVHYAEQLAKSGRAGKRAKKMAELCDEIRGCISIWDAYAPYEENALRGKWGAMNKNYRKMRKLAYDSGADSFIESLLVDGVPLEDILA